MARPPRNNVDYFPYLCKIGKPMRFIEQKYGNDGFAVWIKILRELAITNFHHLTLSNHFDFVYLSSECKVTEERLASIIQDLCDIGEIDKAIWKDYHAIYSQKFIDSIQDAYKKRENKCIDRDGVLKILIHGKEQYQPEKNKPSDSPVPAKKTAELPFAETKDPQTTFEYFKEQLKTNENIEHVARTTKIDKQTVVTKLNFFIDNAISVEYPTARDMKNHFVGWLRKNINEIESQNKTTVSFGKKQHS